MRETVLTFFVFQVAVDVAKQLALGSLKPTRTRPLMERFMNYFLTRPPLLDSVLLKTVTKKVHF